MRDININDIIGNQKGKEKYIENTAMMNGRKINQDKHCR